MFVKRFIEHVSFCIVAHCCNQGNTVSQFSGSYRLVQPLSACVLGRQGGARYTAGGRSWSTFR